MVVPVVAEIYHQLVIVEDLVVTSLPRLNIQNVLLVCFFSWVISP